MKNAFGWLAGTDIDGPVYTAEGSSIGKTGPAQMLVRQVTQRNILRVLVAGFALVILLLLAAGFVGIRNLRSIQENAADLVAGQLESTRLIDEVQREQGTLTAVYHNLMRDPESVEREKVLAQLGEARQKIDETVALFADTPEEGLWRELKEASAAFSAEARRLLALEDAPALVSRDLFRRYQEVLALVAKLIAANHRQAEADQQAIDRRSKELVAQSVVLLGACLLLALVCAALTARMTAELFRKMEWQTSELSRISWHLLERQETAARRFSHELHDELGQSLTALKANLMALACPDPLTPRVEDCLHLVDEAIRNVRELSQLLRPTILDDFGLDAALRSLCDGFRQRTGIEVDYASNLQGRLPEETETHLFRIAQEALTNVARHSGASQVRVALETGDYQIELSVSDNGRGLSERAATERRGFGMIGMRARARSAGGELTIQTGPGRGVVIEARVPVRTVDSAGSKLPISSA